MPLLKLWSEDNGLWGIWHVTETADELRSCLSDASVSQELELLKASSRKMEYLAVRVLLKTMLGREGRIEHEASGKPFLAGKDFHISISHTKGYVAIGLHRTVCPGIDIEVVGEKVRKVASRFIRADEMSGREQMGPQEEGYQLLLHWSAKETLFKVLNTSEVDFLAHLKVQSFELASFGTFIGESYRMKDDCAHFVIHYLTHPDFVCTYCLGKGHVGTNGE